MPRYAMEVIKKHKKTIAIAAFFTFVLLLTGSLFLFQGLTTKNAYFFFPRRLSKIAAVLLVGYCVSYSSVTFQTITNNRLLTPSIMGFDALYLFIQTVIVMFSGQKKIAMMSGYTNFFVSVFVMIICSFGLFLILFRGREKNIYFLLLTGTVIGSLFGGLSSFMQVLLDPHEFSILQNKMFASFNNVNQNLLQVSAILVAVTMLLTVRDNPYLDVVSLGQEHAVNLGVNYRRVVLKNLMVTAVLVSISTALVGPITFLGILVVSITRKVTTTYKHTARIAMAFLTSSTLLVSAMYLTERVFKFSAPISVLINFAGGIYFIYLILKEGKA